MPDVFTTDQDGDQTSVLDSLVGKDKKFESVEALAEGKAKSDEHITKIEQENADLKEKLEAQLADAGKGQSIEELMAAIKEIQTKQGSEGAKTMSTEELQEVVRSVLQDDKATDTKEANRAKGNELVLKKTDGNVEAARALVAERATALGLTPAKLAELSETSPTAFAALIDQPDSTASSGQTSVLPSVRTDVLDSQAPVLETDGFKTKAWFDAKKKEVGHVKYLNDQSIQAELARSMNGLGERFNN